MRASFRQQTSFIERLQIILVIIAAFFVLGIMGLYLSSRGFLMGLQEIAYDNRLLNISSTSLQALQSTREHLDEGKDGLTGTQLISIREAIRLAENHLREAMQVPYTETDVIEKFSETITALKTYQESVEKLASARTKEGQKEEGLIVREYLADAEDDLREIQILLKKDSDQRFSDIYANRFDPLIVAGLLSSTFFAFVVIVGMANARRLRESIRNLIRATDAVATGDLTYEASVLESDEFGRLTYEFNRMVSSLRDKQQRLTDAIGKVTRLQRITNSFSAALLPDEVFDVIVLDVYRAIRADAGAISLLSEDGKELESRLIGYSMVPTKLSMDFPSPMTACVRSGEPVFIDDVEMLKDDLPQVYKAITESKVASSAYIPLVIGDQIYGGLNFGFKVPRHFSEDDREFMIALTRQCALALHRARLYKEATDAIQVRDEFLSIASHELRTPLTPLKLQLQNMSRQVKRGRLQLTDTETVLRIVENSDRQVDRLITLIDDLLDVSRISSGRLTLNFEEFNFGDMVAEVISHYSAQMKEAQSLLTCDIDKTIICRADRVRMEQVLINLLTNAAKYAPKKPIYVTVKRKDQMVHLEVRDEGEGISQENQRRIFDRFERVRDKNNIGGLGLGLYICRQIVEAHQGHIGVSSEPHRGSTFVVEIPLKS